MANPSHQFTPLRTSTDDLNRVQDKVKAALDLLADQVKRLVDAAVAAAKPATVTIVLQTVAVTTHAQLRAQLGSNDGVSLPRAVIVAGDAIAFDGGQGVYAWDAASTLADNNTTVIQPTKQLIGPGRWRKV